MKKIWTNGCFDVLHIGHIKMLQFARSLGDNLIVGIDSDKRVASLKGSDRPINNQNDRVEFLRSIKYVDDVFVFNSKENMCDILIREEITDMVIGEEYRNKEITGNDIVPNIHFFPKIEGFSTTEIINEIGS
tara:strand:- start:85 stop:480 length:396 start_codon:yes stop_codon:yes gene_type:complete